MTRTGKLLRRATVLAAVLACVAGLSACAQEDPVRPLIDLTKAKSREQRVTVDDANAQRILGRLKDEVVAYARQKGSWTSVDVDVANTLMDQALIVPANYPSVKWGGGIYAVSALATEDTWIGATPGDGNETCWFIKLSGDTKSPSLHYALALDNTCQAASTSRLEWKDAWPTAPERREPSSSPSPSMATPPDGLPVDPSELPTPYPTPS